MKKFFLMLALVAATNVWAQPQENEDNQQRMQEMIHRQTERLAKSFNLEGEAKEQFTATFIAYQKEMFATRTQGERPEADEAENSKKELTAEEAKQKIEQNFARQEQQLQMQQKRLEVQKKYYAEFSKTLTPQQILRIMSPQRPNRNGENGGQRGGQRGGMRGPGGFGGPRGGFGGPGGGF